MKFKFPQEDKLLLDATNSEAVKGGIKKPDKGERNKPFKRKFPRSIKNRGIIYLGSIPHGFYEDEMEAYFSQFGKVTKAVVARSKKTGRSKGFGFVEFEDKEVAKVAAEAMNNYLMFNKIIKCRYIPQNDKRELVRGKFGPCDYPRKKHRLITLKNNKQAMSKMNQATYLKKVQKKIDQFKKFFDENGIDFSYNVPNEGSNQNETKTKQVSNKATETKLEDENQVAVLEIDESDNEISFKTPPQVKKVIKKSLKPSATSSNKEAPLQKSNTTKDNKTEKGKTVNLLKSKNSKKVQEKEKINKKSGMRLKSKQEKLEKKLEISTIYKEKNKLGKTKKKINTAVKENNLKVKKCLKPKVSEKKIAKNRTTRNDIAKLKKAGRKSKAVSKI